MAFNRVLLSVFGFLLLSGLSFALSCGDTITTNTVLTADLGPCSGDGLVMGANNIVLDCDGHSIQGTKTTGTSGVYANIRNNLTIKNCNITDFDYGVRLPNTRNSIATNNTLSDNNHYGFLLVYSNGDLFDSNTVSGSIGPAFALSSSSSNNFTNNTVFGNSQGISLSYRCTNNRLIGNSVYNNGVLGIYINDGSNNTVLTDNTLYDDELIIRLSSNNNLTDNALSGVLIEASSDNNRLVNNTASGIAVQNNSNNTLLDGNAVTGVGAPNSKGIAVSSGSNWTAIMNCDVSNFDYGIDVQRSDSTELSSNTVHDNADVGVFVWINANLTTISEDHYYNNGLDFSFEGNGTVANLNNVIFDNPAGNLKNYTMITLSDVADTYAGRGTAYYINWTTSPAPLPSGYSPFVQKFVEIKATVGAANVSIDSIAWHWLDSESAGYDESRFELWKYNASGWTDTGATLDTAANTLSLSNFNPSSVFAILHTPMAGDSDGDGVPDDEDDCSYTAGYPEFNGCPYADEVEVRLIVHDPHGWGACPGNANHCELNLSGVDVRVYNTTDPAFVALWGAPQKTEYPDIFENGAGLIGSCTTDASSTCLVGEVAPGDYLVLGKYYDAAVPATVYTGASKTPADFNETTGLAAKDLMLQKMYRKDGKIQYQGGQLLVVPGSFLEIVAPLMTYWEGAEQLYPFVFKSDSDWTVDICLEMPKGYAIRGTYDENGNLLPGDCEQSFVSGESRAIIFVAEDVGSPPPHANARIKAQGPKGGMHSLNFEIPGKGIEKAAEKGKGEKKGVPFRLEDYWVVGILLVALAALFIMSKRK